jgi:hypothetical protein
MATGLKELNEHTRKDGLTVKKLIASLLVAAFVCSASIGCGDKTTPAAKPATTTPAPK